MVNYQLAQIFEEISLYLEMQGVEFKPQAYSKAGRTIEGLSKDLEDVYKKGGEEAIRNISGIGESIAEKIIEYIKTGKIDYYQDFKEEFPVKIRELTSIEGVGPKTVKALWEKLGVKNIEDLEKAAKEKKIQSLYGFDEKTEENIIQGIEFLKRDQGRFLLGEILPKAREIEKKLRKLKEVEELSVSGSLRRKKATIGDLDFLAIARDSKKVMDFFVSMPGVAKVWGHGETKSSIRLEEGIDVDLRVLSKESFGAALQYFTGSKQHNIKLRSIAMDKGLKLNEYGIFREEERIAGENEEEVYNTIGLTWIPPELRENRGEIEAAREKFENKDSQALPAVISYDSIKGELHSHTKWNGGMNSIEEMAEEAWQRGYKYLGISDHGKLLRIEGGLNEEELEEQVEEIRELNKKWSEQRKDFQILQGVEANILSDGSIDIAQEALKKLDYAIAGIHSDLKMSEEEMTKRIVKAMRNPYINIISHPTGRVLQRRGEYEMDFDKILEVARETNTVLEINSNPVRLDLSDTNIRKAKKAGVKMIINTDSHQKGQMHFIELGIAQARRGWAEEKDIINTYSLKGLKSVFQKKRNS